MEPGAPYVKIAPRLHCHQQMSWQKRALKDIEDLKKNGFEVRGETSEEVERLDVFLVRLTGPKDTPYEGGSWFVRFTIPQEFPFKSPSVGFVQNILHPNIDWASGSICLDALNTKWSPCFTIRHVMDSLLPYLLTYPNPDDPLNRTAADLLKTDAKGYDDLVRKKTSLHALKS